MWNRTRVLGMVSLAVLCLFLAWSWWVPKSKPVSEDRDVLVFTPDTRDRVRRIELGPPDDGTLVLERAGDVWLLPEWGNYPAEPVYTDMLLDVLFSMKRGEIVTDDPDRYPLYHLNDRAQTITLRDGDGRVLGKIMAGKPVAGFRGAFVRIGDEPAVRLVYADLVPAISRIGWGDRSVWRVPPNLIESVSFTEGSTHFQLSRDEDKSWRVVEPPGWQPADDFTQKALPALAHPRSGLVVLNRETNDFLGTGMIRIVAGQAILNLAFGKPDHGFIPAARPGLPMIYYFPEAWLRQIQNAVLRE